MALLPREIAPAKRRLRPGKRGEAELCCDHPPNREASSPIFLDDGPSAVSSVVRILPGDGTLRLVNSIQVERISKAGSARAHKERAPALGRDQLTVPSARPGVQALV